MLTTSIQTIYEDDALLILRKPWGIAVESARVTEADLVSRIRAERGAEPFVVHRLDQVVEGLVAFALTKKAAAALTEQIRSGTWQKRYVALVCGEIPGESGELIDYLVRDGRRNLSFPAAPTDPRAKRAVLRYRRLEGQLLGIELVTGRHHQIRVQLSHAGMPIAGDFKYGAPPAAQLRGAEAQKEAAASMPLPRGAIALCATGLAFLHPLTGKPVSFRTDPSFTRNGVEI